MNILVTGVAGFLGSWLASDFLDRGHKVVGIDDLSGGNLDNVPQGCFFREVSVLDLRAFTRMAKNVQVIYHCAALPYEGLSVVSPSIVVNNIVTGAVNVGVVAANCKVSRVVNCSSMSRYGVGTPPFSEEDVPAPVDPYGMAKVAAEQHLTFLGDLYRFEVVHAVPHNIIGPRQNYTDPYRNVLAIMLNRALQRKPLIVYGDGEQKRCFSDIKDVVPVLMQLGWCQAGHGEVFNVGPDGEVVTINHLADLVQRVTGYMVGVTHMEDRPREVKVAHCSSEKIRRCFNYQTTMTLEKSIDVMARWMKKCGPRPFRYHLPIEVLSAVTPKSWTERLL